MNTGAQMRTRVQTTEQRQGTGKRLFRLVGTRDGPVLKPMRYIALALLASAGAAAGGEDIAAWNQIQNSRDCSQYEGFLRQHPKSKLVGLLRKKAADCPVVQQLLKNPDALADGGPSADAQILEGLVAEIEQLEHQQQAIQTKLTQRKDDLQRLRREMQMRSLGGPGDSETNDADTNDDDRQRPQAKSQLERIRDPLRDGGEGPEMVVVPAGCFQMGSPASETGRDDDEPQHRVCLSRAFGIGTTEVTFADYDRFARATGRELPNDRGWGRDRRPVINVSWQDATAYADWLSDQTGAEYRLPSEAEWEYAARAGTTTAYWWGDQPRRDRANYGKDDSWGGHAEGADRWKYTAPVGSFPANAFGLHDTAGNVLEWVEDWYDDYPSGEVVDPVVRQGGSRRVYRGGCWYDGPRTLRSAYRSYWLPGNRNGYLGFRLARTF